MPSFLSIRRAVVMPAVFACAALLAACDDNKSADAMLDGFSDAAIADVQRRVDDAIALAGDVGHDEVIRRINDERAFLDGASYVFVLNERAGVSAANPIFPATVGKGVADITDTDGNSLAVLLDATADGNWVEYQWINPETAKPARKVSWIKKTGDYIYGCGLYE